MSEPLVSIVIPVFNKDRFLVQTLRSVINQSYKNWECIIIDDGSTDNSLYIARTFFEGTNFNYKVISVTNNGQAAARNRGVNESIGDYVAFLDGDDLWHPNKLERQIYLMEKNPKVGVVLAGYAIFEKRRPTRVIKHANLQKLTNGWIGFSGFGGGLESVALIRKAVFCEFRFDERLSTSSGLDFFLRISSKHRIILSGEILMAYLKYPGQWHRGFDVLREDSLLLASKLLENQSILLLSGLSNYQELINLKTTIKFGFRPRYMMGFCKFVDVRFVLYLLRYLFRQVLPIIRAVIHRRSLIPFRTYLKIIAG